MVKTLKNNKYIKVNIHKYCIRSTGNKHEDNANI